ncbi:hypothetical protein AX17_000057 [Amanita inopinata Kibby_2008]|nr:hypothetical protein AX17_000057 [Amanita inopinata Kibby_2008]
MTSTLDPIISHGTNKKQYYRILAGQLFDSYRRLLLPKQAITVDRQRGVILDVRDIGAPAATATDDGSITETIDLQDLVVLPGFVDVHVHMFLHPYSETSWNDQLTKESLPERTLRAGVHAWKTLQAGFTTVRDLGTEGAFDADIALRKCLASDSTGREPIVNGPRYYCANRTIVTTGSYGPKSEVNPSMEGVEGITGAEVADGKDACVRAVRRQIGVGADWIKIYADYKVRSRMTAVSSVIAAKSMTTFSDEELGAMIDTAHALGVKVAAHANGPGAIKSLLKLGVDTVEHGGEMYKGDDDSVIREFVSANGKTIWVPTLAAYYTMGEGPNASEERKMVWEQCKRSFMQAAVLPKEGGGARMENIACGGDTGVFAHGQNALELMLMRALEAEWNRVLAWATLGGWRCVRGMEWEGEEGQKRLAAVESSNEPLGLERGVPFGAIRKGWAADIIAVNGRVDGDFDEFSKAIMDVVFVTKGGRVYKRDGRAVVP